MNALDAPRKMKIGGKTIVIVIVFGALGCLLISHNLRIRGASKDLVSSNQSLDGTDYGTDSVRAADQNSRFSSRRQRLEPESLKDALTKMGYTIESADRSGRNTARGSATLRSKNGMWIECEEIRVSSKTGSPIAIGPIKLKFKRYDIKFGDENSVTQLNPEGKVTVSKYGKIENEFGFSSETGLFKTNGTITILESNSEFETLFKPQKESSWLTMNPDLGQTVSAGYAMSSQRIAGRSRGAPEP